MKDKKFLVMCTLGIVWVLLFFAVADGIRPLRNVLWAVSFFAIAWFAYWTFSAIRWAKKPEPKQESEQPNADTKKETDTEK